MPQTRPSYEAYRAADRVGRRASVRAIAIGAVALIAVAGASTAALHLLRKSPSPATNSRSHSPSASSPASSLTPITPSSASGFDALNPSGDNGDENSDQAGNVLDGNPQGWNTQYYRSAHFGNLKTGTGFMLNLGKPAQVSSVTVTFGTAIGAKAQIKVGDSDVRSPSNLAAMHTVAGPSNVSGAYTFTIKHPVSGQYLVIWFTKLPPLTGKPGWFEAQIFKVVVTGTT
jgi:hypothetical protein